MRIAIGNKITLPPMRKEMSDNCIAARCYQIGGLFAVVGSAGWRGLLFVRIGKPARKQKARDILNTSCYD